MIDECSFSGKTSLAAGNRHGHVPPRESGGLVLLPGKKDHHKRVTTENPARPSRNRMTARVNDERRNFGASYNFRVHQALGNLRTPRRF
jgi:hypothetical protein